MRYRRLPRQRQSLVWYPLTWDRAEAHLKNLRESAERKEQEYHAAVQRATDHALIAEKLKEEYWKARRELDKNAGSCASTSEAEQERVVRALMTVLRHRESMMKK